MRRYSHILYTPSGGGAAELRNVNQVPHFPSSHHLLIRVDEKSQAHASRGLPVLVHLGPAREEKEENDMKNYGPGDAGRLRYFSSFCFRPRLCRGQYFFMSLSSFSSLTRKKSGAACNISSIVVSRNHRSLRRGTGYRYPA